MDHLAVHLLGQPAFLTPICYATAKSLPGCVRLRNSSSTYKQYASGQIAGLPCQASTYHRSRRYV